MLRLPSLCWMICRMISLETLKVVEKLWMISASTEALMATSDGSTESSWCRKVSTLSLRPSRCSRISKAPG